MEEVVQALRDRFDGADIKLRPGEEGGRIHGFLIWEGFAPLTFLERQHRVYDVLQDALGREAEQVGMVFTYTPREYAQIDDD